MKVRKGFVSNSSSSSFVIITKKEKLSEEKLMDIFDVDESSIIYPVVKKFTKDIIYCTEEMTDKEFLDNYSYGDTLEKEEENFKEDYPEYYEYYKLAKENKDWTIYYGSADNYEYATVAETVIDHEDDNIIIKMEGEY